MLIARRLTKIVSPSDRRSPYCAENVPNLLKLLNIGFVECLAAQSLLQHVSK